MDKKIEVSSENSLDYLFTPETVIFDGTEIRVFDAYLPTEIGEYEEILDIVRLLRSFTVMNQLVRVYVRGFGGDTMIGTELINAMNSTKAHLEVIVSADCYSMHSIIAISQAHHLTIEDGVQFMFHEGQLGMEGGLDNVERALQSNKHTERELDKYVQPFLTDEEYSDMIRGRDVYVTGEEMRHRIKSKLKKKRKVK